MVHFYPEFEFYSLCFELIIIKFILPPNKGKQNFNQGYNKIKPQHSLSHRIVNQSSHGKRNSLFFSFYPTRLLCQMQANSSGAEFLSTISKFMKRMNFVIACLRPSQNMKLGIFTGSRAVDGKEMYKKVWCTCKVVVLPCQAIAYLTFSSPPHL